MLRNSGQHVRRRVWAGRPAFQTQSASARPLAEVFEPSAALLASRSSLPLGGQLSSAAVILVLAFHLLAVLSCGANADRASDDGADSMSDLPSFPDDVPTPDTAPEDSPEDSAWPDSCCGDDDADVADESATDGDSREAEDARTDALAPPSTGCPARGLETCNAVDDDHDGSTDEGLWCWVTSDLPTTNMRAVSASGPDSAFVATENGTLLEWDGTAWSTLCLDTTAYLASVAALSPTDIWAAGSAGGVTGYLAHWDGAAWRPYLPGAGYGMFRGLRAFAPADIWVIGGAIFGSPDPEFELLHWDGASWSGACAVTGQLWAVDGSSSSDIWAVGQNRVVHWDGATCFVDTTADTYMGVASLRPDDVWLGGAGWFRHWDGSSWSDTLSPVFGGPPSFFGITSEDIWAVGYGGGIAHFDGMLWSPRASGTTEALSDVAGTGPSDVWAVGWAGTVIRWDGGTWSSYSPVSRDLWGIWGASGDDVWAVGAGGTVRHFDGADWSTVAGARAADLYGVWGSSTDDVWAVGAGVILHWGGVSWAVVASPETCRLASVAGSERNDILAVGNDCAMRWDGTAWASVAVPEPSGTLLLDVWLAESGAGWVVGSDDAFMSGIVLRWDGHALTPVAGPWDVPVTAVWGFDDRDVWFATETSLVHWDGTAFDEVLRGSVFGPFRAVWGARADDVWAVAQGGILHWDGRTWVECACVPLTVTNPALWGESGLDVWLVGDNGTLLRRRE